MGIRLHKDWPFYALFRYFWILVILPKAVQLLALGALMLLMFFQSREEKPLNAFSILQLLFLLIYGVSIVVNALSGTHQMSRIFAAVNTWTITLIALIMYHQYRHTRIDLQRVSKLALFNLVVLILLWVLYTVTKGNQAFTLFGHALTGPDWVDGLYTPRFLGYMDYANLVVFAVLFFYPLSLICLRGKTLVTLLLTAVLFLAVEATNSRSGLVLYFLLLLAYFLFEIQKQFYTFYRQRKYALFALAIAAVLLVCIAGFSYILNILNNILSMREGSNGMRSIIYSQSLSIMWEQSPIWGIGIKDMLGDYPLGSHSTYIGVFYKAGILGGLIYMVSILSTAGKLLLGKDPFRRIMTMKICILSAMLLMAFEDVDGANWCVCIFYTLLGLLESTTANTAQEGGNDNAHGNYIDL